MGDTDVASLLFHRPSGLRLWPLLGLLCSHLAGAKQNQIEFFTTLKVRAPTQCVRSQCLSASVQLCRQALTGFYNMEKGCKDGQICTNCQYGNSTVLTTCSCENPPYSQPAAYGQPCNSGIDCQEGQGVCFRPCSTYLHVTLCPDGHCQWNTATLLCENKTAALPEVVWASLPFLPTVSAQAEQYVNNTVAFPMSFASFEHVTSGYRLQSILLQDIMPLVSIFLELDLNRDGFITPDEFARLPMILNDLDRRANSLKQARAVARNTSEMAARRLQLQVGAQAASPLVCNSRRPRQYFCSFDSSCKVSCNECGWKSATDQAFAQCVQPSPATCNADSGKVYCPTDDTCHPPGDCSGCVDRPIVDFVLHQCQSLWWDPTPLTQFTSWVCRYRNKVGMPCRSDQDCIYGMHRCLLGQCQPLQPYNPNQTCTQDVDCPHLGYYCPSDPTGGENPYWVQYCRLQRDEGTACTEDRECKPTMRCNTGETPGRCRTLFSLPIGQPADRDEVCQYGWRDKNDLCAPAAKSKVAGRSCDSNLDCLTTDKTGRTGVCTCKTWWDRGDSSYCAPVSGDFVMHQQKLRAYLWFKATKCGSFWTEEECLTTFGKQALRLKYDVECETQKLSGGPYIPPADCGIVDPTRFVDSCAMLKSVS